MILVMKSIVQRRNCFCEICENDFIVIYKVLNMEKAFKIRKILETMIKNDNLHKNEIFQRKRISIYYYLLITNLKN